MKNIIEVIQSIGLLPGDAEDTILQKGDAGRWLFTVCEFEK